MIEYLHVIFTTNSLTREEWGGCVFISAFVLFIATVGKSVNESFMEKIPIKNPINEDVMMDNKILRKWNGKEEPTDNYKGLADDDVDNLDKSNTSGGDKFEK